MIDETAESECHRQPQDRMARKLMERAVRYQRRAQPTQKRVRTELARIEPHHGATVVEHENGAEDP